MDFAHIIVIKLGNIIEIIKNKYIKENIMKHINNQNSNYSSKYSSFNNNQGSKYRFNDFFGINN